MNRYIEPGSEVYHTSLPGFEARVHRKGETEIRGPYRFCMKCTRFNSTEKIRFQYLSTLEVALFLLESVEKQEMETISNWLVHPRGQSAWARLWEERYIMWGAEWTLRLSEQGREFLEDLRNKRSGSSSLFIQN